MLGILALVGWGAYDFWTTQQAFGLYRDPVAWCLLGLTAWTWCQTVPLPARWVAVLNPQAAEWHEVLRPAHPELTAGDIPEQVPRRSAWLPLSIAPLETQRLGAQLAGITLLYLGGRLLVGRGYHLRHLTWAACGTGLLLSLAGIIQYLSGERERIYGQFVTDGPSFGAFVNKNHFAFQIELLFGLSFGLWLAEWRRHGWRSPVTAGVFFVLGLMFSAVVLSQSRGGVLAMSASLLLAALLGASRWLHRRTLWGGVILLMIASAAWLLWLGNEAVFTRLATLWHGEADNRTSLWQNAWRLVPLFPLTGTGGGGYTIAELVTRPRHLGPILSTTAHNEYLEAWIEGGILRGVTTLLLVFFTLRHALRAYRCEGEALNLGCFASLAAVALHSIIDAGIHVPSVALGATIIAVFAASRTFQVQAAQPMITRWPQGCLLVLMGMLALAAALPLSWDYRADKWQQRAAATLSFRDAVYYLEQALRWRPRDFESWEQLAALHLQRGIDISRVEHWVVAGPAAALFPADLMTLSDGAGHFQAALRASRAARDAQPLWPGPHLRIAALLRHARQAENMAVHLTRAQTVGHADPDVWFACGQVWAVSGNWAAALHCWKESLVRSPKHLPAICRWIATSPVSLDHFRQHVLTDDPLLWYQAAKHLFPSTALAARQRWYSIVADRFAQATFLAEPLAFRAWADALIQCGRYQQSLEVLQHGVQQFPHDRLLREMLAIQLELEDRFAEARIHWEWLAEHYPDHGPYARRAAAARRAATLQQVIDSQR
jgi:O-antigen ligase/tetratricopeptide (TPR) repeat protein